MGVKIICFLIKYCLKFNLIIVVLYIYKNNIINNKGIILFVFFV